MNKKTKGYHPLLRYDNAISKTLYARAKTHNTLYEKGNETATHSNTAIRCDHYLDNIDGIDYGKGVSMGINVLFYLYAVVSIPRQTCKLYARVKISRASPSTCIRFYRAFV